MTDERKDFRDKKPEISQRVYPEDERLRDVQEHPDRRMTREEWEHEESLARQAAHKCHEQVMHDREVQQEAQLKLNRVTRERWRTLVAKIVFSRQDGDQREADYQTRVAAVASAQRNIESFRANLRRPCIAEL